MNNSDDKENLPAEQPPPREETRISRADGDEKRSRGAGSPSCEGSQTFDAASLLKTSRTPENDLEFTLPKAHRLRKPAEFQSVYKNGKRFDGRLMSAFVLANNQENHRLGITASRKGVGNAVQRNRAKRLLREAFRLSKNELTALETKFDFVINARRNLLQVKMQAARADFQKIVAQIAKHEESIRQNPANNETAANVNLTAR